MDRILSDCFFCHLALFFYHLAPFFCHLALFFCHLALFFCVCAMLVDILTAVKNSFDERQNIF